MAELDFETTWARYIGANTTPAEWAAGGWNMARILSELQAADLTGPEMMEAANVIAAGLEELGLLTTRAFDALTLTTAHAASSYGRPVLLLDGEAYGPGDLLPDGQTAAELLATWAARFCGADWQDPATNPYLLTGAELDRATRRAR